MVKYGKEKSAKIGAVSCISELDSPNNIWSDQSRIINRVHLLVPTVVASLLALSHLPAKAVCKSNKEEYWCVDGNLSKIYSFHVAGALRSCPNLEILHELAARNRDLGTAFTFKYILRINQGSQAASQTRFFCLGTICLAILLNGLNYGLVCWTKI